MGFAHDRRDDEREDEQDGTAPWAQYVDDEEELLEQSQRQVLEEKRLRPRRFRG
jgi:hypothetical protein